MDTDNLGWLIAFILYIVFLAVSIILNAQIAELKRKNENLQQQVKDYKWQIEQVPYVIENWCEGE